LGSWKVAEPQESGGGDGRGGRLAEAMVLGHTCLLFISILFRSFCFLNFAIQPFFSILPADGMGANTSLYHVE
jgi:hypothetical protein